MAAIYNILDHRGEQMFARLKSLDPEFVKDDYLMEDGTWDIDAMDADIEMLESQESRRGQSISRSYVQ